MTAAELVQPTAHDSTSGHESARLWRKQGGKGRPSREQQLAALFDAA